MANALKKITAEAKRIQKRKPRTSWKSAIKTAAKRYKSGTIRKSVKRKKAAPRKKRAVRGSTAPKRARRRRVGQAKQVVKVVRVTKVGRVSRPRSRRMAGSGGGGMGNIMPIVLLAGAGLLAWYLLRPKAPQLPAGTPPVLYTQNQQRNTQTNEILQYALAGGLAIDAITKLIQSLNSRSDSQVQDIYDNIDQGGGLPPTLFV